MKFIVIKKEDAQKYLPDSELQKLRQILNAISDGRKRDGKKAENEYWVCNIDEPYAEIVHGLIMSGERKKN